MLAHWEQEFPGRTEAIFSALCNVTPSHLADPAAFDFKGLEALRAAAVAAVPTATAVALSEPWME
jgi:hypothetical protein